MVAGDSVPMDDAELDLWLQEQLRPVLRTEQDEQDAEDCRRELEKVVRGTLKDGERWRLVLFGSSVNGFGTRSSDLDMTALADVPADQGPGPQAEEVLVSLASSIGENAEGAEEGAEPFRVKASILTARPPILKILRGPLEVDLSVGNWRPLWNSRLLRAYASMDERVVGLVLGVKLWAQKHGLVGASTGHLSSYALAQLAIHFLQRGVHPPLPNLHVAFQRDPAAFESDELALEVAKAHGAWPARATLAALYRGFFRFYAEEFDFGAEVVSVRLGRLALLRDVPALDAASTKPRPRLHVEDPFELARDLGHVLRDGGIQLMDEMRKERQQLSPPSPAARELHSILSAEAGQPPDAAALPEPRIVGPDPACVPKTPLRAPSRTDQERVRRIMSSWSAPVGGSSAIVEAHPSWGPTPGPTYRNARLPSSRMPRDYGWGAPPPARAPAPGTSPALLQQWPSGASCAGVSPAQQHLQRGAYPDRASPAIWQRPLPNSLTQSDAALASRVGRINEPPGRRARGDLHAACQKIIGGNRQENGALYSVPQWVGDGYQCTVRCPKLPDSWGLKIWTGRVCETEQDSKHSAAQVALNDILSDAVFVAKYHAPPKRFAPLDPSISVKDHLHSTCLRVHRLTPEKDGEVKYETQRAGDLYVCTVRMPRLPDGWGQKRWAGEECATEIEAQKSAAWVALSAIFADEGLMARHNAPPARVAKQARKRKQ